MPSDKLKGKVSRWQDMDRPGGVSTSGGGWPNVPLDGGSQNRRTDAYKPGSKGAVSATKNPDHVSDVHRGNPSKDYKSAPIETHLEGSAIDHPRRATGLFTRGEKRKATSGVVNRLQPNRKKKP